MEGTEDKPGAVDKEKMIAFFHGAWIARQSPEVHIKLRGSKVAHMLRCPEKAAIPSKTAACFQLSQPIHCACVQRGLLMSGEPEFNKYLANHLTLLLDGMKGLNGQIARQVDVIGRYDVEFAKLRADFAGVKTEIGQTRIDLNRFRSSVELQMEAILRRLDALDSTVHDSIGHIHERRSEGLRYYNEILNALQDGHQNRMSLSDLADRVSELERLAGRLPPPVA
jgi:septal ring factor EnvC (AmiA/AmiB activator)